MYKAADLARAKANIDRHEWAAKLYARMRSWTKLYDGMSRERLRSFIGEKTPLVTVKCPECGNGPWYAYQLTNGGDTLQCKACKNRWHYDPEDRSETWNVQAVLRSYRLWRILGSLEALGIVYQIEGDRQCAEKAAILVERFAEVFKGYRTNMVNRNRWCANHPYYGKIDGWKFHDGGSVRRVLLAYDLIHDSGALTTEQCERIDRDLVAYARDYFVEGYAGKGYLSHLSIQDQGPTWWCIAACGALLGDEDTLKSIVQLYEQMLDPWKGVFHEDGSFFQCTASYNSQLLSAIKGIPEIVRGNLDRDVYSNPKCDLLRRCHTWILDALLPDGTVVANNDTHVGTRPPTFWSEIAYINYGDPRSLRHLKHVWGPGLSQGTQYSLFFRPPDAAAQGEGEPYAVESTHLPGMGLMVLRHGDPPETVAYLDYGPYQPAAHKHVDYLNFGLWACGMEMVTEMGYSKRWVIPALKWQRSARAHNTVLEVAKQADRGRPVIWCITPGPKMAEAGLPPGNSRFIALLPRRTGEPIIVDIFRVRGDETAHNWVMHARAGRPEIHGVGPLEPTEVQSPLREGRQATAMACATATWRFPGQPSRRLKVLMPTLAPCAITASECPPEQDVIDATHVGGGRLKPGAVVPYRGHLRVSKPGPAATFVAIYVPARGDPGPEPTAAWHPVPGSDEVVALEVECGAERMVLLHAARPAKVQFGPMRLEGRAAVARLQGQELDTLCVAEGTLAEYGGRRLSLDALGDAFGQCTRGILNRAQTTNGR